MLSDAAGGAGMGNGGGAPGPQTVPRPRAVPSYQLNSNQRQGTNNSNGLNRNSGVSHNNSTRSQVVPNGQTGRVYGNSPPPNMSGSQGLMQPNGHALTGGTPAAVNINTAGRAGGQGPVEDRRFQGIVSDFVQAMRDQWVNQSGNGRVGWRHGGD